PELMELLPAGSIMFISSPDRKTFCQKNCLADHRYHLGDSLFGTRSTAGRQALKRRIRAVSLSLHFRNRRFQSQATFIAMAPRLDECADQNWRRSFAAVRYRNNRGPRFQN